LSFKVGGCCSHHRNKKLLNENSKTPANFVFQSKADGPGVEINPGSEFNCCLFKERLLVCSEGGRQELQHLTTDKKEHPQIEMTCKNREKKVIFRKFGKNEKTYAVAWPNRST
jgi:hypothetical protein